jgi:hypothetical protein
MMQNQSIRLILPIRLLSLLQELSYFIDVSYHYTCATYHC